MNSSQQQNALMFYGMIFLLLSRRQKKGTWSFVQGPPIGVDIIPQNLQIPHAIYISFTYIWTQFISYLGNYLIVLLPYFCSNMEDFLPMSCIGQRRIFFLGIKFFSDPCPYEEKLLYVKKASKRAKNSKVSNSFMKVPILLLPWCFEQHFESYCT